MLFVSQLCVKSERSKMEITKILIIPGLCKLDMISLTKKGTRILMRDTNDLKREPFSAKILFNEAGAVYAYPKEAFPKNQKLNKELTSAENDPAYTGAIFINIYLLYLSI